jgi:DNA-binding transcriptional LysR family regulator
MQRGSLDDLVALVAVGRERSFTKVAAKLGVSQSALSQTVRQLEARLGVRLLTRTTRSVSPTEAGERLLRTLGPRFEAIDTTSMIGSRAMTDPLVALTDVATASGMTTGLVCGAAVAVGLCGMRSRWSIDAARVSMRGI